MESLKQKNLEELAGLYKKALGIVVERSKKYATEEDPFKNFVEAADFAGVAVEQGFLVRIGDKLSRLKNAIQNGDDEAFSDEAFDDTVADLVNYFGLLRNYRKSGEWEQQARDEAEEIFDSVYAETNVTEPEEKPGLAARTIRNLAHIAGVRVD